MPSLVEFDPMVLGKMIFKNLSMFFFHNFVIISLGKWRGPSFVEILIPFIQGCFVPSLVKIGPVVLEKRMNM